jgi:hypothetical protein
MSGMPRLTKFFNELLVRLFQIDMKGVTFGYFHTFNIFIVNCSCALFKEFIALNTKIDDLCAFHREVDELFCDLMDDVGRCLEDD